MEQPELKPRLIHSKRGAVIALCVTGYTAALSFRDVLSHPKPKHHWLLDLDWLVYWHMTLPAWVVAGVNLGFFGCLLWGGVGLYRMGQGKERVLVVGGAAIIFLGFIQVLVSGSAATAIDYVQAAVTLVAFFAAVDILLRMPASGYPRVDKQTSGNT